MKTFLVHITGPQIRNARPSRNVGIVPGVNTPEEAIEVAKCHFPPPAQGWMKGTTFEAKEMEAGKMWMAR